MREKLNQNLGNQEAVQASFFKLDPQSWPDLPPPLTVKPKQHRNPYKLLGVAHFTDRTVQYRATSSIAPDWKIPQSKLVEEPILENRIEKQTVDKQENIKERRMRRVRLQAKELMQKLQSGEVERSQALLFYKNNATDFIPYKSYEYYRDYAAKHRLKIMSWPEYARAVILERFSQDFYSIGKRMH